MEIELPNNAEFDTEKSFDNQTQDCQEYFFEIMNASEPFVIEDSWLRPQVQIWEIRAIGFNVQRFTKYATKSGSWKFEKQWHMTQRSEWHEDKSFQIIMHSLQLAKLSKDYPDFVYSENKKRESYIEGDYIYQYTDVVLDEHRVILDSYGIIINSKI